ncbi:MAG TPA: PKD domain-containing protein, partial [Edaphocola sp.]|nr:PKD domain-containing protein [Edaphocola sp.]
CEGTPVTLNAGNPGSTYLWNTGATTQSIVVNATGQYIVTTTNINNCSINDTANVIVRPLPIIDLGSDTTICDNSYLVLDAENPGSTYLWSTGSTNQIIIVNQEGVYSVLVTSAYGCQQTDNIELFIYDDATVDGFNFVPMVEIDPKRVDFWPINPESVTDYLWDFGDGNTSTVVAPSHTYDSEGYYLVSLTVSNECGSNDTSLLIHVDLVTGVKAVNNNIDVEVYPVPAQNKLTIETLSNGLKIKSVSLFSTLGQELHVINQINNSKTDLDITTLPSGNYFLKIETDKGMTMRRFNIVK